MRQVGKVGKAQAYTHILSLEEEQDFEVGGIITSCSGHRSRHGTEHRCN